MTRSRPLVTALVALAVVVLTACSGDDDTTAVARSTVVAPTTTSLTSDIGTTAVAGSAECADQAFTPNSEDIAGDIVATGLPCAEAEALMRRIGPLVGAVGGPAEIEIAGYACVRTSVDDGAQGIPSSDYRCTSGDQVITFKRT